MNKKQWTVLLLGVTLFALSELFPPFVYEDENTSARRSAGYHFINNPPKVKSPAEMRKIFSLRESDPTQFMWAHRDPFRLDGQRIILIFLTPGLLLLLYDRRTKLNLALGVLSLCIALVFVGLYILHVSALW